MKLYSLIENGAADINKQIGMGNDIYISNNKYELYIYRLLLYHGTIISLDTEVFTKINSGH